jgi:hypothetical protein
VIGIAELVAWVPTPVTLRAPGMVKRVQKGVVKQIDVAKTLLAVELTDDAELRRALDWPEGGQMIRWQLRLSAEGGAKPSEVLEAITGSVPEGSRYARIALRAAPVAGMPATPGAVVAGDPDADAGGPGVDVA